MLKPFCMIPRYATTFFCFSAPSESLCFLQKKEKLLLSFLLLLLLILPAHLSLAHTDGSFSVSQIRGFE